MLANYLKNEYPQTVAVVISKIRPEHAARVLAILPEELALDVVSRMLTMEAVQKDVIERLESTLRTEFMSNLSQTRRRDAHEVMAEIFNNFDRQTETRFITALEEQNREAAERIKTLMFTFDDLVKLDAGSAQTLMRHVDKDKLGVALKGATETVRQFFLGNMSTRAAKMLVDDMQALGPVRLRDVDEAQALLVNLAKDLAAKGEIMISKNRADEELSFEAHVSAPVKFLFEDDFARPRRRREAHDHGRRPRGRARARRNRGLPQGRWPPPKRRSKAARPLARERIAQAIAAMAQALSRDPGAARRFRRGRGRGRPQARAPLIAAEPLGEIAALRRPASIN